MPFAAALGLIAVLELGDKTQLSTISLASRHPAFPVFVGASAGLALVTGIGVVVGAVLSGALAGSLVAVRIAGGAGFVGIGILELVRPSRAEGGGPSSRKGAFIQAFGMNALAELGDKTQLAVVVLAATMDAPVSVFAGASVGLSLIALSSVLIGSSMAKILNARSMRAVAAVLFIAAGIFLIAEAILAG